MENILCKILGSKKILYQTPFLIDMLEHLTEMVYVTDEDGCIVYMNSAAEKFDGFSLVNERGKYLGDIYYQDYSPMLKSLKTGEEITDADNLYITNGAQRRTSIRAYPVYENGVLIGAYSIQTDITSMAKILSDNINYQRRSSDENSQPKASPSFDTLIGRDPAFLRCIEIARIAARNDTPILLSGPTGSGKEMFAKSIHKASPRKDGPYLAINCSAIPETLLESVLFGTSKGSFTGAVDKPGLFEQAKGGTLFLDEINSMALESQAKLLRVLEEQELRRVGGNKDIKTDVRIISSINTVPQDAMQKKQLREDLFYRLAVVNVIIPALKDRGNDISLMTDYFLEKFNRKYGKNVHTLSPQARSFFMDYDWPGNVRQLKHAVESAISITDDDETVLSIRTLPAYLLEQKKHTFIEPLKSQADSMKTPLFAEDIPSENPELPASRAAQDTYTTYATAVRPQNSSPETSIRQRLKDEEKQQIIDTLLRCKGNVSQTARELSMHRQTLIYKMKKYGIS